MSTCAYKCEHNVDKGKFLQEKKILALIFGIIGLVGVLGLIQYDSYF